MQVSRREFMIAGAGGAALGRAALAARSADTEVRPLVVDCQSHLYFPEILARMEKRKDDPVVFTKEGERWVRMGPWVRRVLPKHMDLPAKLADMDANGIAVTAISINDPGPEWFGADGPAVARECNDFIAGVVRRYPQRFVGLCVLPLQDMTASMDELERCVRKLGMRGILLYTNLAGRFADEPEFRPLFARAVEYDIPVLLHPAKPVTSEIVKDYEMISSLGNMFDDTIALNRILLSGILDQYPGLKLVCPHLGGTLPYIIGRIDHQVAVLKRGPRYLTKAPSAYLRQVYLDIVSPLPQAMRFAYEFMGADRLLYASDHPWVDPKLILDGLRSLSLPKADEEKILGGNAQKLFRL
ncbi:MAG: amidohydrolase [Acidobacteria bacterium]|nr:amidohydrolase [Acidobacteriota bacterium]